MSSVRISYVRYRGGASRNVLKKTARIFYARLRALLFAQPPVCHKPIPLAFTFLTHIYIMMVVGARGAIYTTILFTFSQEGKKEGNFTL